MKDPAGAAVKPVRIRRACRGIVRRDRVSAGQQVHRLASLCFAITTGRRQGPV